MAKHTPPDDNSFQLSLVKHASAAVALVAVVAAAFWGVGQIRTPEDDLAVEQVDETASEGEPARTEDDPIDLAAGESETDTPAEPTEAVTSEPAPEATEPTEAETSEPEPEPTPTPTPSKSPSPKPSPTATAEPATSGEFAPGDISVQVLDAVLDDGGETSKRVFDELKADGYRAVARNQAVRKYDVTTVMYTPGNEAKARQIAKQYGYSRVEPQPGNLSNSVDVHLVVGADA